MQVKTVLALCGLLAPLVVVAQDTPLRQAALPTVKLSPTAREQPLSLRVPSIPIDAIRQFLGEHRMTESPLDDVPQVSGFSGERIVASAGDRVYVEDLGDDIEDRYTLVRPGQAYRDPETNEILGYEALYVGDALVEAQDEERGVATLLVTRNTREVLLGDRLVPVEEEEIRSAFLPKKAPPGVEGHIVSVVDGVSQIGQYQIVLINQGENEALEPGHLLDVRRNRDGERRASRGDGKTLVDFPSESVGKLMVFRVLNQVSYALVMEAQASIATQDAVRSPD